MNSKFNQECNGGGKDLTRWPSKLGQLLMRVTVRLANWSTANIVLACAALVGCALVVGLTVASAETYEAVEAGNGIAAFDRPALDRAISLRTEANVDVVNTFTALGGPVWMTVITVLVTLILTFVWRTRTPLTLMLIGVAGSLAMTNIGKQVVGRVRPPLADAVPPFELSPSFPSGHTLNSTVIAGLVAYLIVLRLRTRHTRLLTVILADHVGRSYGI